MNSYVTRPDGRILPEYGRYWDSQTARKVAANLRKAGRDAMCWKLKRSTCSIEEAPLFAVYAESER